MTRRACCREPADLVSPADGQESRRLQPCARQHGGRAPPPGQDPPSGEKSLRAGEQQRRDARVRQSSFFTRYCESSYAKQLLPPDLHPFTSRVRLLWFHKVSHLLLVVLLLSPVFISLLSLLHVFTSIMAATPAAAQRLTLKHPRMIIPLHPVSRKGNKETV